MKKNSSPKKKKTVHHYKKTNIKEQYKGNYYTYKTAEIKCPKNTKTYTYEYIKNVTMCDGGVEIIPIIKYKTTKKKKLLTILNYRYPLSKYILEFPGGAIDKNETYKEAAIRELKEETGFFCDKKNMIELKNRFFVDPWKSDDTCRFFLAIIDGEIKENLELVKDFDDIEDIKNYFIDLEFFDEDVERIVKDGKIGLSVGIGYFGLLKQFFEVWDNV